MWRRSYTPSPFLTTSRDMHVGLLNSNADDYRNMDSLREKLSFVPFLPVNSAKSFACGHMASYQQNWDSHRVAQDEAQLNDLPSQSYHKVYLPPRYIRGFPSGSVVKNPFVQAGDTGDKGLIHGLGRSPGEGNGNSLQCSCLENPKDRGAWQAVVHGVTKSQTRLISPAPGITEGSLSSCSFAPPNFSSCVFPQIHGSLYKMLGISTSGRINTVLGVELTTLWGRVIYKSRSPVKPASLGSRESMDFLQAAPEWERTAELNLLNLCLSSSPLSLSLQIHTHTL